MAPGLVVYSVIRSKGLFVTRQFVLAPLVFGVVLDLGGGNRSLTAWGLAFASIGIFGVLAPVARWLYLRRS